MSLPDELLADFEDLEMDPVAGEIGREDLEMESTPLPAKPQLTLDDVSKLKHSDRLKQVLEDIERFSVAKRTPEDIKGPVEVDPEYLLIVKASNMAVEIDRGVNTIHKYITDVYAKRSTEMESHVVKEARDLAKELDRCKSRIYSYIENKMAVIAPNLSIVVGATIAAKLMAVAGGLTALSKMPACSIQVLGNQRPTLSGRSATEPHAGYIFQSPIVQNLPPDLRRKAARLVGTKCALAARVDAFHESLDGSTGRMFQEEIKRKMRRFQGPPSRTPYTRGAHRIRGPVIDEETKVRISNVLLRLSQRQRSVDIANFVIVKDKCIEI